VVKIYIFETRFNKDKNTRELLFDCDKSKETPITLEYCENQCNRKDKCRYINNLNEKQKLENMEELLITKDFKDYYLKIGGIFIEEIEVVNEDKQKEIYFKMLIPRKY